MTLSDPINALRAHTTFALAGKTRNVYRSGEF